MANKVTRKDSKMYVRISSKLEEQLDMLADYMGTTKSSLVTYYVAQGVKQEMAKASFTKKIAEPDNLAKLLKALGVSQEEAMKIVTDRAQL